MFRDLRKDEIEVRVAQVTENSVMLLLYKDARCDMNILDEKVGPLNWKREHTRDNKNCIVSIWDDTKKQWISKEDVGVESNTEKEKGLASDSFKRACFNWGIGRELYTTPPIFAEKKYCNIISRNGRNTCYDKFCVENLEIKDKKIVTLSIWNLTKNKRVFVYKEPSNGNTGQN